MTATPHTAPAASWASLHRTLLAVLAAVALVAIAGATVLAFALTGNSSAPSQPTVVEEPLPQPVPQDDDPPTQYCSNRAEPVPC
ncbi:hypothetical protein ACI8AF_22490 [Blastococcus sp. SYSU D00669]